MTEIDKMYKLANVQAQYKKRIECKEGHSIGQPCGKCPCINCDKSVFKNVMPPFTTEKQLEIIKWFISNRLWLNLKSLDRTLDFSLDFDEKLAKLVNRLWESFYGQEKEEIRNILNA